MAQLKLLSEGTSIHGVGIDTTGKTYLGKIWFGFHSKNDPQRVFQISYNAEITSAALDHANHFDGILGRDILRHCDFRYDGKRGTFSLEFHLKEAHV